MQITKQHSRLNNSIAITATLFVMAISGLTQAEESLSNLALLDNADKWQMNHLFEPTTNQVIKNHKVKL